MGYVQGRGFDGVSGIQLAGRVSSIEFGEGECSCPARESGHLRTYALSHNFAIAKDYVHTCRLSLFKGHLRQCEAQSTQSRALLSRRLLGLGDFPLSWWEVAPWREPECRGCRS